MAPEYFDDSRLIVLEGLNWEPFDEQGFTSPWAPRLWRTSIGANYLFSTLIALIIAIGFALASDACRNWCLIPLILCGILSGSDIVAWLRKEIDTFDPKAIIGGILYLSCFIAPLLHLTYNIFGKEIYTNDWPTWFGYMACFNAAGIILFKLAHNVFFKVSRPAESLWQVAPDRFSGVLIPVLVISILASMVVKILFSGLVKEAGILAGAERYAAHLSWLLMLGDPGIMLVMMALIYWIYRSHPDRLSSLGTILLIIAVTLVFQFMLLGLRGSRSAILSTVIIIAAVAHYRLRPISIKFIVVGMCLTFIFVYFYGFYKRFGARGWEAIYSRQARESMSYEFGEGGEIVPVLLGNLARADLQAFMLYRLKEFKGTFQPVHGQTYMMSALTFIPRGIWKTKPSGVKARAGTEIQGYSGADISSRVYGLAGEAMLNFSYYGILPAFFVFGCFLGWFRKKIATMEPSDSRFFLIPILILYCMLAVNGDSDNWMFGLLKMGVLPFIVVFLGSIRSRFVPASDYM
jgi:hypothetical protein